MAAIKLAHGKNWRTVALYHPWHNRFEERQVAAHACTRVRIRTVNVLLHRWRCDEQDGMELVRSDHGLAGRHQACFDRLCRHFEQMIGIDRFVHDYAVAG